MSVTTADPSARGAAAAAYAEPDVMRLDHKLILMAEQEGRSTANGHWLNQVLAVYVGYGSLPRPLQPRERAALRTCEVVLRAFSVGGPQCAWLVARGAPPGTVPQPPVPYLVTRPRLPVNGD